MSFYGGGTGGRTSHGAPVVLHVYDLAEMNDWLYPVGVGAFHSGVEVLGEEYTFASEAGVFSHSPKGAPGVKLRESIPLGIFEGGNSGLRQILDDLRADFPGTKYNTIERNCNHFADALCRVLVGRGIPDYVNRLAWLGSFVSCLFPDDATQAAPVEAQPLRSSGSGTSGNVINPGMTRRTSAAATRQSAFSGAGHSLAASTSQTGDAAGMTAQERKERVRLATLKRMGQAE